MENERDLKASKGSNGLVLCVDDEKITTSVLRELLESRNYAVLTANGFEKAVDTLKKNDGIEAIICDLKMPHKSAFDVLRYMKEYEKDVPMVILTGCGTIQTCQQALDEGASSYVLKATDSQDLLLVSLKKAIEKRRQLHRMKQLQSSILRMAEEHASILASFLEDNELSNKVQKKVSTILNRTRSI